LKIKLALCGKTAGHGKEDVEECKDNTDRETLIQFKKMR
jgi:hypothetical protein